MDILLKYSFSKCVFLVNELEILSLKYSHGTLSNEFVHPNYMIDCITAKPKKLVLCLSFSNVVNVRLTSRAPQKNSTFTIKKKIHGGTRFHVFDEKREKLLITRERDLEQSIYKNGKKVGTLEEKKFQMFKSSRTCNINLMNDEDLISTLVSIAAVKLIIDMVPDYDEINLGYYGKVYRP